jgi:hypothetical protein
MAPRLGVGGGKGCVVVVMVGDRGSGSGELGIKARAETPVAIPTSWPVPVQALSWQSLPPPLLPLSGRGASGRGPGPAVYSLVLSLGLSDLVLLRGK